MTHVIYPIHSVSHRPTFNENSAVQEWKLSADQVKAKKQRITDELKNLGVTKYGLMRAEFHELPLVIHDDEHLKGIVNGHYKDGFAILVATDRRVLFLDKKPLFMRTDEVTYNLVGGVSYGQVGLFATVNLHTRVGDYKLRTMNVRSAYHFIEYIERRCLEHSFNSKEDSHDYAAQNRVV